MFGKINQWSHSGLEFFTQKFKTMASVSLIEACSDYRFLLDYGLADFTFQVICLLYLHYQTYGHRVVDNIPLLSL